jgi:hypothetical protein
MTRLFACALAGGALVILASASPAFAAGDGFCRDYARAAVRQVHGAMNHMRCVRHIDEDSGRWSDDFEHHYRWCREVSREQADAEREARRDRLEHCAREWR